MILIFNRLSLMLIDLLPEDDQHDVACEGFGNYAYVRSPDGDERKGYRQTDYDVSGNDNSARRVMFEPRLGLSSQERLLPLRCCPLQIELELVNSQADAATTESWEGHQMLLNGILEISNVSVVCSLLIMLLTMNLQAIPFQGNLCQSVSVHGVIVIKAQVMITNSALISLVQ